ncbi:MAG: TonB-dependent receptor [Steroidobacteraceae bacterium]
MWVPFLLGAVGLATAADAPAPAAQADQPQQLEEVVVTGLRVSLERSLNDKKNSSVVQDSIDAEELGRFPDSDVADSLQHLPGITIDRTTGGEGQKVSVRGFGPQYNIVTLNNRILATDDDARDLAFDVLPSEVISAADVLKSTQASALEGSIGGTVNLRTASPFEKSGFHGGAHVEGNYNDMSEMYGRKFSAFIENTMFDETLGFLVGGVYSNNKTRTDSLNAYNQNIYGPTTYPFEGGDGAVPVAVTPNSITFGSIFDDKKREALSGSLEWRPNDSFRLIADGLWTKLQDNQQGYNQSYYFPYGTYFPNGPDQPGVPTWSNATVNNGLVTAVTSSAFQPEIVNNTIDRNVVTSLYGVRGSWQATDRFKMNFDAYRSTASRPEGGSDSFVTAGLVSQDPTAPDILVMQDLPHSLPSLNVLIPPGQLGMSSCPSGTASKTNAAYCSYTALMNTGALNDNKYWSTHYDGLNGFSVHDQVTGFTLDGAFKADVGPLDSILFGAGYNHREKTRVDNSNDWTNGSGQYGLLYNTAGCPVQCAPYTFGGQGFNVISFTTPPHFMQGAGGSYPNVLPRLNVNQLLAFMKSLDGLPNPQFCPSLPCDTPFNLASTLPQPNPFNSYDVIEKTFSFYTEATFKGDNWSGNVGVRVVHTKTQAQTAQSVPVSLWSADPNASTVTYNVQYSDAQAFSEDASYTFALPSANFNYWLIPDTLQLRAAGGETMARPDLNQLAPNATNSATNGEPILQYTGIAGLKPIKAWNLDLSAEWYYQPHAALTLGLFGKKVTNDIYTGETANVDLGTIKYDGGPPGTVPGVPFLWTVTAPANGAKSTYTGVELSWQHFLDMGLGAHFQVTRTWSRGYDQDGNATGAVNQAPPTTLSTSLIYEKGPFSADVNWDYTSRFTSRCAQCTEVPGWPAITDPFSWVTASAHWRAFAGFEVYVEGRNLTNAIARTYLNGNPLLPWAPGQSVGASASGVGYGYTAYGRSYVAGLSYRF